MYEIIWDFGDLDCRDPQLQARLGMSLGQIINSSEERLHSLLCRLYNLPTTTRVKFNGKVRGFKPYYFKKIKWILNYNLCDQLI